jgi:phenylalanyl-tRNA synthetase beta chain
MKVPYSWLREWVDVPWDARELGSRLTMCGFELEGIEAAAPPFTGVVVAEILEATRHPQADKLQVCKVSIGQGEPLQIVCGAPNARAGLKSALAIVGANLPGDLKIKAAKLRGVDSQGMLCSARELGLSESHAGILELAADAPLGKPLREYLQLDDFTVELNVTPNRGDAMSIIGIAREVSALSGRPIAGPKLAPVPARSDEKFPVKITASAAGPKFVGRVIRGINNKAATPVWMRERLRRAGVRSISPIVDVTNFVLLELGQPMHAYDLSKLQGEIDVRMARADEPITLLDDRTVKLDADTLVIVDRAGPVGVAGIMGGNRTSVSDDTVDVFFEVAYFAPDAIAGRARRIGLHTDASQRYERGVDPANQERAMERATALLLEVAGGTPGPTITTRVDQYLPRRPSVHLRRSRLSLLLGTTIDAFRVEEIFRALQMEVSRGKDGWDITPPSHRFDISIEADLIEEVARIIGFDAIPESDAAGPQRFSPLPEELASEQSVLDVLAARGYHEAITYAFVDPAFQSRLFPERETVTLSNPIASDLSTMRVSLWPGLLRAGLENQRRQQDRVRLFEHGATFDVKGGNVTEIESIAAVALGPRLPEQWGIKRELTDFYDVKADVEALIAATGDAASFSYVAEELSCLHPGRSAKILRAGKEVGWIGELHPALVRELAFNAAPIMFELNFADALGVQTARYAEVSRFPQVRRDIAVVVDEAVSLSALRERVTSTGSSLLQDLRVFDVYRGSGVESGRKSVALGLIFQDISRTLTDEDVDQAVASIVTDLRAKLDARIRE